MVSHEERVEFSASADIYTTRQVNGAWRVERLSETLQVLEVEVRVRAGLAGTATTPVVTDRTNYAPRRCCRSAIGTQPL